MGLSTHILDTALGRPVAGIAVALHQRTHDGFVEIGTASTDSDGRCTTLLAQKALEAGTYRLLFMTANYFQDRGITPLYPFVEITFTVTDASQHHHIPLLLTANGYTTYRGS